MKSPLITMSAITGKPTKQRIFEYLKGLKECGIEQAMIYPRSGCQLEYLSEEWFDTIAIFIKSAQELDMCLWLYDDFNWPSGDACGKVTAIPEYRLRSIVTKGDDIGTVGYKSQHNSNLFGEKYFPNLLCEDAVDYFIKCTHEEYYKRFGEYFGNIIKGIFTDEPSIGYCSKGESIPYYEGLEDDYYQLFGRSFKSDMLAQHKDFYLNSMTAVSNKFNKCYITKISDWCKQHGILMTGHLLCDNDPMSAAKYNGNLLENLSAFDLPGIDEISTCFSDLSEMTLLGTIEYASGENGAMAELFALGPCDMSYAKQRSMIFLAACHKINNYFLAISHMDMRGNMLVTDYFNNFSSDRPDFKGMKLLAEEAKKAAEYAKKDYTPDVYVRYPFSVCARNVTSHLDLTCFFNLINELTYNQIQWKFISDGDGGNIPVVELDEGLGLTIGQKHASVCEICNCLKGNNVVLSANGDTPHGIFVRKFNDDSMVIINLFAPSGEYLVNGRSIYINEYDVLFSDKQDLRKREGVWASFDVTYHNQNMIRMMYLNSQSIAKVICHSDMEVSFAVRNDTEAYLDDQKINCRYSDALPTGIREIYGVSSKAQLQKGEHTVKSGKDFKYMPSVFLIGDFSAEMTNGEACGVELTQRKKSISLGETLKDFGAVELSTDITVPTGAKAVEIVGTELYTCMYADGVLLGEKIASPYIYDIEKGCWGKTVKLKIVQYSSMGPIFGDVDYWDKNAEHSQWRGTPSPKSAFFGLEQINWIF